MHRKTFKVGDRVRILQSCHIPALKYNPAIVIDTKLQDKYGLIKALVSHPKSKVNNKYCHGSLVTLDIADIIIKHPIGLNLDLFNMEGL